MTMRAAVDDGAVAIVGIGCRFPGGANDPESFWRLLLDGRDAIGPVPADRIDVDRYFDPRPAMPGRMANRVGGFVGAVDGFDAAFFGIAAREAERIDPQHRLVLETAWEALEDAGIDVRSLAGSATGVFVGQWTSDFESRLFADTSDLDLHTTNGTGRYATSGRLSYALRLMGPSMTIDTACSSSLAAVHLAVRSLRDGESTLAIAGGVNLILQPHISIGYSQSRMMAPDGHCKFGDARGDGYVRSEGVGVVVLKPLRRAVEDGDRIYATIRGTALNNDGGGSGSMGRPSAVGQEALLRRAYEDARVDPATVGYVEAHGTGTRAGDPVELAALGALFGARPQGAGRVLVGSVKTNIGHTESAAGIAGLIKGALVLHRGEIPPSLHLVEPNPSIPWSTLPLEIPRERVPWPRSAQPRYVGVTAFGISGTNAHAVLEEAPARADASAPNPGGPLPLAVSASDPAALRERVVRLREVIAATSAADASGVRDLCHTATVRRTALDHRMVAIGRDAAGLVEGLDAFLAGEASSGCVCGPEVPRAAGRLAFVFSGQGGQHAGMGRALYEAQPVFREALDRVDAAVRAEAGWSPIDRMFRDDAEAAADDIDVVQPMLFAIQVALAATWRAFGVVPDAVVGHSLGEVAAAHVAGALPLEEAVRVIVRRSQQLRRASGRGAMAVVELDAGRAAAELSGLEDRLSVAAFNSRRSTVLSGDPEALETVLARLESREVFCRRVQVDVASHSPQMDPLVPALRAGLAGLVPRRPTIRMVSTALPGAVDAGILDADYWGRNLREPVRLSAAVARLLDDGFDAFVEIGPHPLLLQSIRQDAGDRGGDAAAIESMRRGTDAAHAFLQAVAAVHVTGRSVDWRAAFAGSPAVRSLPAYPWQRSRHWRDPAPASERGESAGSRLLGRRTASSVDAGVRLWPLDVSDRGAPWLRDHRVRGAVVVPAAVYVSAVIEAATEEAGEAVQVEIQDLRIDEALVLGARAAPEVQLAFLPGHGGSSAFRVSSRDPDGGGWRVHASGRVRSIARPVEAEMATAPIEPVRTDAATHLAAMSARGLEYGPAFRPVGAVAFGAADTGATDAEATLSLPREVRADLADAHPVLIDGGLQVAVELVAGADRDADATTTFVPIAAHSVVWRGRGPLDAGGRVRIRPGADAAGASAPGRADLAWIGADGEVRLTMSGLRLARLGSAREAGERLLHGIAWRAASRPVPTGRPDRWLVLEDRGGVAVRVADALRARGAAVAGLRHAGEARIADVAAAIGGGADAPTAIATFVPMDAPEPDGSHARFELAARAAFEHVVELANALTRVAGTPPRLVVVTRGAQAVLEGDVPEVAQAFAWGATRTVRNECPELRATVVDLSAALDPDSIATIALALSSDHPDQFAVRGAGIHVPGLVARGTVPAARRVPPGKHAYRFATASPGVLDGLIGRLAPRPAPGPEQVEIAVSATGLNFMNVLSALGRYPGFPGGVGPLGIECAGTVVRCGSAVRGLEPGAKVMAYAPDSLASHVLVDARLARPIPAGMTVEAAAGWPVVFMTALHALVHCARLQRGERVLIHAAAGGVGLAAVQIALDAGAEIFATVGSPAKRALLASLGVRHVMDSRSLAFRDEVLAATDGEGVDVVLNSLAGDFVAAGLDVLRPYGRFVEIGKQDIYADTRIGLLPFRRNLSYFAVDLDRMARERPERAGALLEETLALRARGVLSELPMRVVPVSRAVEAFGDMAAARHHGKLVLSHEDADLRVEDSAALALERGACLITGGLGGLGLRVAAAFAERGARRIALLSRSAPDAAARAEIDRIRAAGTDVAVLRADVGDREALGTTLSAYEAAAGPIAVVVHAAGRLDDAMLADQSSDRFERVRRPKAEGAWHLHAYFVDRPDVQLVLFSSVVSLLGLPGQANYAAANAFLDALARRREAEGGRCTSIHWGPWADVGMAAMRDDRGARLAANGLPSLSVGEGLAALERILEGDVAEVVAMRFDRAAYLDAHPAAASSVLLPVATASEEPVSGPAAARGFADALRAEPPGRRRREVAERRVAELVARVLREPVSRIDRDRPFRSLGLDSLMGLELRNRLEADTGLPLPATLVWNHPNVAAMAAEIAGRLDLPLEAVPQDGEAPPNDADPSASVGGVPDTSDTAEDALLLRLLSEVEGLSPDETSRALAEGARGPSDE